MKSPPKKSPGFALIEALVALAVVSLGSMGLAGVQMFLARNGDLAVQRTQATVIADACLEALRAYAVPEDWAGLPARPQDASGASVCPAGPTTIAPVGSNTSYTRQVFVGAAVSDNLKPVTVKVSWQDRAGETHSLDFTTVIAKSDPADAGRTVVAQTSAPLFRNPNDRNISIPTLAIDRLDGTSSLLLGTSQIFFDNQTGMVVRRCSALNVCTNLKAYYLEGYVKQVAIQPSAPSDCGLLGLNCLISDLLRLLGDALGSVQGLGINYSGVNVKNASSAIQCSFTRDSTGLLSVVTNLVTGLLGGDKYFYYKCTIPFVDPAPQEAGSWGGVIRVGLNVNPFASTPVSYLVCRYQFTNVLAPAGLGQGDVADYLNNKSNTQPYRRVRYILSDQNYMLFTGVARDIPADCPKLRGNNGLPEAPIPVSEVNPAFPPQAILVKHQRCISGAVNTTECPGVSP